MAQLKLLHNLKSLILQSQPTKLVSYRLPSSGEPLLLHSLLYACSLTILDFSTDYTGDDKLVGRVAYALVFDPWVKSKVATANNKDQHVCLFEFIEEDPWKGEFDIDAPAQHLSHNCPTSLVTSITFTTTLPNACEDITRQTVDATQPAKVDNGDNTCTITSILEQPKTAADAAESATTPKSQDAWHFPIDDAFTQSSSSW